MNDAFELYRQQSVQLATPGKLIVMLFDGAIKNMKIACMAIDESNIPEIHSKLILCQDIFQELIMSLDNKYPISKNLQALYEYIKSQLVQANLQKDKDIILELLPLVSDLRDTWVEAEKQSRIQNAVGNSK